MKLKWYGTASVEIENLTGRILFDPFVPLKGSDVDTVIGDYDGFSDIFITHGHFDHIVNIAEIVKRNPSATVYCTKTPYATLSKKGVAKENLRLIEYGQRLSVNGFEITVFYGKHTFIPKVTPRLVMSYVLTRYFYNAPFLLKENRSCKENDESVFYHIECDGKSVSLIGSMNLRGDVEYPVGADAMILPYNGWGDIFPQAVEIIGRLHPKRVFLDHYDVTFPPLTKPIDLTPIIDRFGEYVRPLEHKKEEEI